MRSQEGHRTLRVLWGVDSPTTHGPQARWTLADIAHAAVAIADENGLAGVSLAKVAAALDLAPTALYRYVDSKSTLVDLMVDAALGDGPTLEGTTWQERARSWVGQLADRYRDHPWLADYHPRGMPRQPRPFAWINALVEAVGDRRIDGMRLALLLEGLVRTYAGLGRTLDDASPPEPWLVEVLTERHPALAPDAGDRAWTDVDEELEYAVDIVLRGVAVAATEVDP